MRRPHWRSAMFTATSGALGLAILAGCTTQQAGYNAYEQSAQYLRNARGTYRIPGPPGDPWGPYIREASTKFDIPEPWIRGLMHQESGGQLYQSGRLITSSAGAMGLMQVMPGTYAELRARWNLGPDPYDPHENIMAGVAYMREMYDMYGSPGFLAAYNAGPNRLDDYLANQRGLPDETRRYVAAISPSLRTASPRVQSPAQQYAMNQLPTYIPPGLRYGYGQGVSVPTVQLASASPAYSAPVFTQAAVQPSYAAAQQPRGYAAWTPPAPAYTPAPVYAQAAAAAPIPQGRAVAWNEPPRPAVAPAPVQTYAAPAPRVVASRDDDDDYAPSRHSRAPSRLALSIPPNPPMQRSGGSWHLISSAMAAEVVPSRHGHRNITVPVSYERPAAHGPAHGGTWKLHATGPIQAAECHKNAHGKLSCGSQHL
jgi:hypothetical protein